MICWRVSSAIALAKVSAVASIRQLYIDKDQYVKDKKRESSDFAALPDFTALCSGNHAASANCPKDCQQNDCTDKRDYDAHNVDAGHITAEVQCVKNEAADEGTDDTNDDVHNQALFPIGFHHQTRQPASNCTDDQPCD